MASNMIRISLDVSPSMKEKIDELVASYHTTQADVFRKAIALLITISKAEERGESPALIKDDQIIARLVGV
jgi:Arc/MetJ-type ribon-helix-helix transcriptional regulator